jgi:hypothetical protein
MSEFAPAELAELKREIEERFPRWTFVGVGGGYGEAYVAAERLGTTPDRQCAMTARGLVQAIEDRERQLASVPEHPTAVVTGVHSLERN